MSQELMKPGPRHSRTGFMSILGIPAVCKTIVAIACLPFVCALYNRLSPELN
jgi:hypothetical protein